MKKNLTFLALIIALVAVQACNTNETKKQAAKGDTCAPLNPNGDSELALLMREMAKLGEMNAVAIREGKDLAPYEGQFEKMLTAKRTMHIEEDFFQGMAKTYLANINKLYAAKPEDRVIFHNNLIQTCQSCHAETCRGPLKRIDKMIVSN